MECESSRVTCTICTIDSESDNKIFIKEELGQEETTEEFKCIVSQCESSRVTCTIDSESDNTIFIKEELGQENTTAEFKCMVSETGVQSNITESGSLRKELDYKIKKESLDLDSISVKIKSELEHPAVQNGELQNEVMNSFLDSDDSKKSAVESIGYNEKVERVDIKAEPCWIEKTSSEIKCEAETTPVLYAGVKNVVQDGTLCKAEGSPAETLRSSTEKTSRDTSSYNSANKDDSEVETIGTCKLYKNNVTSKDNLQHTTRQGKIRYSVKNKTSALNVRLQTSYNSKRAHTCKICEKSFTKPSKLSVHQLIHEGVRPYKCDVCEKSFTQTSHLKHHQLIHKGIKPHKCNVCEKCFTQASHLKRHRLIHEGRKRSLKCNVCQKSFTSTSSLKLHHLIHEGKRPFVCDICEKSFAYASLFKEHQLIHKDIRAFKCDKCNKGFIKASGLKTHLLIHRGIRPHKCDFCDRSFTQASHLKQHQLIHEGKRPCICKVCEKSFTTASTLKQHQLIHEGKKPYMCDICDKSFTQASTMRVHQLFHEGKRPYKCNICEKSFIISSHLKRHERKLHTAQS